MAAEWAAGFSDARSTLASIEPCENLCASWVVVAPWSSIFFYLLVESSLVL